MELVADCSRCFGLCCVALPFTASADFAVDKAAGKACGNLGEDFRCGIHTRLRDEGFTGCTVYDCFGAGQRVSQTVFRGNDWRTGERQKMFAVFPAPTYLTYGNVDLPALWPDFLGPAHTVLEPGASVIAIAEVKEIIRGQQLPEDKTRLRVGVKGGGCSGFSYMLDLVEEPTGVLEEGQVAFAVDRERLGLTLVLDIDVRRDHRRDFARCSLKHEVLAARGRPSIHRGKGRRDPFGQRE